MSLVRSEEFAAFVRCGRVTEALQARWMAACPCGQAHRQLSIAELRYIAEKFPVGNVIRFPACPAGA
jgi:hypothetical protein